MPGFIDNQTFQRWIALGTMSLCIVGAAAAPPARADTAIERRPTVQISVYNDAGLKPNTLRLAAENAATVFRHAGIDTEWKNCPAKKSFRKGATLNSAHPKHASWKSASPNPPNHAAKSRTRRASFFESSIAHPASPRSLRRCLPLASRPRRLLRRLRRSNGGVAEVIPGQPRLHPRPHRRHETAHLLLGPNSHSPTGLMRAHWNSRTIDDLRRGLLDFNSTESSAMSNRLEFARDTDISADTAARVPCNLLPHDRPIPPQCPNSH